MVPGKVTLVTNSEDLIYCYCTCRSGPALPLCKLIKKNLDNCLFGLYCIIKVLSSRNLLQLNINAMFVSVPAVYLMCSVIFKVGLFLGCF